MHNYIRKHHKSLTVQQVPNIIFDVKFLTVSPGKLTVFHLFIVLSEYSLPSSKPPVIGPLPQPLQNCRVQNSARTLNILSSCDLPPLFQKMRERYVTVSRDHCGSYLLIYYSQISIHSDNILK